LNNLYKWNGNGWDFIMTVPLQSQASRLLRVHNGNYYFNTGAEVLVYMLSSSGSNTLMRVNIRLLQIISAL
jgi:hypothetical protein